MLFTQMFEDKPLQITICADAANGNSVTNCESLLSVLNYAVLGLPEMIYRLHWCQFRRECWAQCCRATVSTESTPALRTANEQCLVLFLVSYSKYVFPFGMSLAVWSFKMG